MMTTMLILGLLLMLGIFLGLRYKSELRRLHYNLQLKAECHDPLIYLITNLFAGLFCAAMGILLVPSMIYGLAGMVFGFGNQPINFATVASIIFGLLVGLFFLVIGWLLVPEFFRIVFSKTPTDEQQ